MKATSYQPSKKTQTLALLIILGCYVGFVWYPYLTDTKPINDDPFEELQAIHHQMGQVSSRVEDLTKKLRAAERKAERYKAAAEEAAKKAKNELLNEEIAREEGEDMKPDHEMTPNELVEKLNKREELTPESVRISDVQTSNSKITGAKFPVQHDVGVDFLPYREKTLRMTKSSFWGTLNTTTAMYNDSDTFIFTGDIGDMWIRDSAAQVHPYISMAKTNPTIKNMVAGLVRRQAFNILHDPYANSFRYRAQPHPSEFDMRLARTGWIATYNYELDSGCYFFRLIYSFWQVAPDSHIWDNPSIKQAVNYQLDVWETEQHHEDDKPLPGYLHPGQNLTYYRYVELSRNGKGDPVGYTGMSWSAHRPSDDRCQYGYLVPSNMFASATLGTLSIVAEHLWKDMKLKDRCLALKKQIDQGIKDYAIVEHEKFGKIYAYEVDGLGGHNLMDDANVPSLLSIPYLGYDYDPEIYANTRKFLLSPANPTFHSAGQTAGIGSPHVGNIPNNIWPMGQIMQGISNPNAQPTSFQVVANDAGTEHIHEGYDPTNPNSYTRPWFCWAEALFAELVMSVTTEDLKGVPTHGPLRAIGTDEPVKAILDQAREKLQRGNFFINKKK